MTDDADASVRVVFHRLDPRARLPRRMSAQAAGLDLFACLGPDEADERAPERVLPPGGRALVPTGLAMALPAGYEAQVRPRSGLALRHGITVLNGPGTIDADYRGELKVLLINHGTEPFVVRHGDRVAQLVVAPVTMAEPAWAEAEESLEPTDRGAGGYGSTGGFESP